MLVRAGVCEAAVPLADLQAAPLLLSRAICATHAQTDARGRLRDALASSPGSGVAGAVKVIASVLR